MICFVHPFKGPLVLTIFLKRPCFGNLVKKDLFCQPAQPGPCSAPTFYGGSALSTVRSESVLMFGDMPSSRRNFIMNA